MSPTFASPSVPPPLPGRGRAWDDPDTRSTLVGVIGVVLFFLFMWLVGPHLLRFEVDPLAARPHAAGQQFEIELAPDTFAEEKPPEPFRFVETNPDAPENVPDKAENFGAHNQQVAQEKPTADGRSERPATEGKKDEASTQIVSGRLIQPLEEMEAVPEIAAPPPQPAVEAQRAEQIPLPGFEKTEGENAETYGSNIAKIPDRPAQAVAEHVEGVKGAPLIEGLEAVQTPAIDPRRPQPRPQLVHQPRVRPAILAENNFGTDRVGPIAYNAKWSNYGTYLQRLVDAVQIQWERMLIQSKIIQAPGLVTVKFVLDSEGKVARIVDVDSSAGEGATRACVSAISERSPYGPWTDDMRAMLGEEQELTFRFIYQ